MYLNLDIFGEQTGRQTFLHRMIASILYFNLLLISSWIEFWFVMVVSKYLNCSTLSKELLPISVLWLRPALWLQHMTMHLVLSTFTSIPVCLLATTKAPAFFFAVGCSMNSDDRKYNLSRCNGGCDAVLLGRWLATFWRYLSLSVPSWTSDP